MHIREIYEKTWNALRKEDVGVGERVKENKMTKQNDLKFDWEGLKKEQDRAGWSSLCMDLFRAEDNNIILRDTNSVLPAAFLNTVSIRFQ